jgi:DNA-binding LacI/PurR family transcriptional regulator
VKSSPHLITREQQPAHRLIFEELRRQIVTGQYAPGAQLPGTRELALSWQTSIFTIHTALRALTKEGWIDRRPNAGTYIADPRNRFLCAGIYHAIDLGSTKQTTFVRNLHFSVIDRLERLGKDVQVFNDSRPRENQEKIFAPLTEAIEQRRIQCLISTTMSPALMKLSMPTAFFANSLSPNRINFNMQDFFRQSARHLAAQGCRSVGLITNTLLTQPDESPYKTFHPFFREAIQEHGLVTRDEWLRTPTVSLPDLEAHGYQEFTHLWNLRKRPDGLIIYPDVVARGAIVAILETGLRVVQPKIKLVFHRNAHLGVLCPFPVMWGISDEDRLADGLIELIQKQFTGEKVEPISLPFDFREE